jgi:AcrR family transcriptional regulator
VSSSRPVGTKGVPRAQREQLILDAATVEFGRFGYAGAALSAVAAQAGVSKPLVLSYFGSKDGLYIACVERAGANLVDHIEAVLRTQQPPRQMAEDTLAAIFEALAPRPHDWNVINDRTPPTGGKAHEAARRVRITIADQAARGVAAFADLPHLADSGDVSLVTDVWISAVTACVNWWLRNPDESAIQMSRRSRRVLTTFSAAIVDATALSGRNHARGPLDTDDKFDTDDKVVE